MHFSVGVDGYPSVNESHLHEFPMKVTITIDTEEGWAWDSGFPVRAYDIENIQRLDRFHELCQHYGFATTYFTNHAVLSDPKSAAVISDLSRTEGTEIGMHVHPWTTPPLSNQENNAFDSFLENLSSEVGLAKLDSTYQLHLKQGLRPVSFRGGRYSTGPTTHSFLAENGFIADASVCPYSSWKDPGAPDHRQAGEQPIRISDCLHSEEETGLWSLPLTRIYSRHPFPFWNSVYQKIEDSHLSRLRLIGLMEKLGILRKIWLNFESEPVAPMLWLIRNAERLNLPYLCFTIHSSSLSVGSNPYAQTAEQVEQIFHRIEQTFKLLIRLGNFEPATVSEIAHFLENGR